MKAFSRQSINPCIIATQYAVRGKLVLEANEIQKEIEEARKKGKNNPYPFEKVVYCNIGNPQICNQQPLTYPRQIISIVEYPELLNHTALFPKDVINHAKKIINSLGCTGTSGAYTNSMGVIQFRKTICKFIKHRDGTAPSPDDVFITDGASTGIKMILNMLISHPLHGIMIPIPQYPLYSASISQFGGFQINYFLDESKKWSTDMTSVRKVYEQAVEKGIQVKGFVCINPGNPTGQVLTVQNMKEIIEFCYEKKICLLADEVYQENIYGEIPFTSFRKVLKSMRDEVKNSVELISFFSVSKGFYGECGKRGGYFQIENINSFARSQMYKIASTNLCSNVVGQEMVEIICNPPKEGDESYPKYMNEKMSILNSLKRKAKLLHSVLNECEGISCNEAMGALYLFPKITFPNKFIDECKRKDQKPDELYCLRMLKSIGVCVVPGSGFGQKDNTYHFRIAILPPENEIQNIAIKIKTFHTSFMKEYSH
ncbi:hypothetical protein ENUP19_0036G0007 [Entamoeba nuttalli]|uniref:Alanine aminotransferase, putative n=2 Tax=Entamoeba nuttalli TaxID=412467 RepID=K2GGI2_ENTNP|nr:alanine aminotransferase, putative [Entamoeba nuttalli P19]EKE41876.1 alanine aminotransferase, putative [Entamoeba nuttalli P19]|eukprot:XP_008855785.1 alanine aminotransferase, putative [Entamoeba nuttalli P19]